MPTKTRKRSKQLEHEESDAAAAQRISAAEQPLQPDLLDTDAELRAAQQKIAANWRFCCFALESIYNTPVFQSIVEHPSGSGALQSSSSEDGHTDLVPKIGEVFLNCWQAFQSSNKASAQLFSSMRQQHNHVHAEFQRLTEEQRSASDSSCSQESIKTIQTLKNQIDDLTHALNTKDAQILALENRLCPAQETKRFKAWAEQKIKPTVMGERQVYLNLLKSDKLQQLQSNLENNLATQKTAPRSQIEDLDLLPEIDSIFDSLDGFHEFSLGTPKPSL